MTNKIIEILLWFIFLGSFINPDLITLPFERRINYIFVQGAGIMIILISLSYIRYIKLYKRFNKGYILILPILIICLIGLICGRIIGYSSVVAWIFNSLLVYSAAILILLPAQVDLHERILVTLKNQYLFVILFGLYSLTTSINVQDILINKDLWVESYEKVSIVLLLGLVPFYIGYTVGVKNKQLSILTVIGYLVLIIIGLRGTSRATFIVNFIVIPISFFLLCWRSRNFKNLKGKAIWLLCGLILIGIVFTLQPDILTRSGIKDAWQETLWRLTWYREWTGVESMQAGLVERINWEISHSRGLEGEDFLSSLTIFDYFIGKGFGVPWISTLWNREWDIVHSGPLHLIYKGGIPLLIVYLAITLSALSAAWRNAVSNPVAMGCFVYLVCWLARFISYGAHVSSYYNYVFWLIVGFALATDIQIQRTSTLQVD